MAEVAVAKPQLSRTDYQALPEGPPHYELIDGELVEMTRPSREHRSIQTFLIETLGPHVRRVLRGELAPEPNLYLPGIEDVYHPDLVYVSRERRAISRSDGIFGRPDLVCEVLSPTTWRTDRHVKLEEYRRAGVPHVWLIEPEPPVVIEEFILGDDGKYRLNATLRPPQEWEPAAFPGWRLSLVELDAAAIAEP